MADRLTLDEALARLGLGAGERDPATIRNAYLAAIRGAHPDVNHRVGATDESASITVAYRLVVETIGAGEPGGAEPDPGPAPGSTPPPPPPPEPVVITVDVRVVADDTIEVAAPPDVTFAWLVQTGHVIGDVTFLDRSAALLQILVSFVDEPICQMIFDLQGRAARGTTEIFCTIDSIEERPAPPVDAVTRFVAEHLAHVITRE